MAIHPIGRGAGWAQEDRERNQFLLAQAPSVVYRLCVTRASVRACVVQNVLASKVLASTISRASVASHLGAKLWATCGFLLHQKTGQATSIV